MKTKPSVANIIFVIVFLILFVPVVLPAEDDVIYYSNQPAGKAVKTFSHEELVQMLAPVALYPDVLLTQILMAAAYPFEVAEAERWVTKNPYVTGSALDEALKVKDWDVSIGALCHYPKILTMMSENLTWTAKLGDAFANQEAAVMDAVQELRAKAYEAGNLATTKEQNVIVEDRMIRIEPTGTDHIYLPAYDVSVVYGPWWYPMFPPWPIILPGVVISGAVIGFSPRIHAGPGVFGWSRFDWRARHIIIVNPGQTGKFNRYYREHKRPGDHRWRPDPGRRNIRDRRGIDTHYIPQPTITTPGSQRREHRPGSGSQAVDRPQRPSSKPQGITPARPVQPDGRYGPKRPETNRGRGQRQGISPPSSTNPTSAAGPGKPHSIDTRGRGPSGPENRPERGGMNRDGHRP